MVTTAYRVILVVGVLLLLLVYMIWSRHMVVSQQGSPLLGRIGQICSMSIGTICLIFIFAAKRAVTKQDDDRG